MPSLKTSSNILALLVLISAVPSLLLSQYTTATLSGIITDSSGQTVPGASVAIENTGTGLVRTYTTGEDGAYLFPALPVGTYRLKVEKIGFSRYSQEGITLDVNQTVTQSVSLRVGELREQVNVFANAEMLPAETSNIAQLIDTQRVVDLPLNGRQAQLLLFLAPGTINTTLYYCGSACQGCVYPNAQWGNINGVVPATSITKWMAGTTTITTSTRTFRSQIPTPSRSSASKPITCRRSTHPESVVAFTGFALQGLR